MSRDTDSPAGADLSGTGADPLTPEQRAWVNALRSGKYEQADGRLRTDDNRYCCLGVACELAVEAKVIPPAVLDEDSDRDCFIYDDEGTAYLPEKVARWIGLASLEGVFLPTATSRNRLTSLNDKGTPFPEIAAVIEARPEGLFGTLDEDGLA